MKEIPAHLDHGNMTRDERDEWPNDESVGSFDIDLSPNGILGYPGASAHMLFVCPNGKRCGMLLGPSPVARPHPDGLCIWGWDGNRERPTLTPSVNCIAEKDGKPTSGCGWHGFITNGVMACLALLLVAASASAQTPTAYRLQFFLAATADPLSAVPLAETPDLPIAGLCGQLKPITPPAIVVDPLQIAWNDPANPPSLDCIANVGAFLLANLPAAGSPSMAGYVVTVTAVAGTGTSSRMLASNRFSTTNGVPPPPPPPPPSTKFVLGQSVKPDVADAWVFDAPDGVMIGTQLLSAGIVGTVTAGPIIRLEGTNVRIVWLIDFASGVDGWVWEDRLIGVAGVVHSIPTGVGVRP